MKIFLLFFMVPVMATAQLKVAKIFSDNIVLQRDQPIHIWGNGIPGKEITVTFFDVEQTAVTQPDSTWDVFFKKQKANAQSQSITIISDHEKIELKNILIGDLWLCLGQSNMQWPMKHEANFKSEGAHAQQPMIRFYNPGYAGENIFGQSFPDSVVQRLNTSDFYKGLWQSCDSMSLKDMSAVGYYFGKSIAASEQIPLGLIDLSIGGAPIETFISIEVLGSHPEFNAKTKSDWLTNDALPAWPRERGGQNVGDKPTVFRDSIGPNHPFKPGFAFANGIQPILQLPIKGIIWYQGESNAQEAERVNEYGDLMKVMITDYRNKWNQPSLPFYFVQLSSIDSIHYKGHLWPAFRNVQRELLEKIDHSGMAVCSDIGDKNDVHPRDKKTVGERLARWALSKTYGKNIVSSGPLPLEAKYTNGKIVLSFRYAGGMLQTSDGKPLRGFSVNGKTEIEAIIDGKTIILSVKQKPEFIYYGWKPFTDANLVNSESLPASTFKVKVP